VTFLAVLPSIWTPYTRECLSGMAPEVRSNLLVLDNTAHNRGVAGSWNVAAREVLERGLDWLVVVSAATRFGPSGGLDFLDALTPVDELGRDVWVVESGAPVGWHLIAWSRAHVLGPIGLWDENHWPAYGEDADMSRRIHVATNGYPRTGAWRNVDVDAWIAMRGHGTELAGVKTNMARSIRYHERKWGGWSGHERFTHPFDDPRKPLSWWPRPPDALAIPHKGWAVAEVAS
jgi:hypothetical protein